MSFYKKYELQRLIADGEAKTFRAIENSTGRLVYLHLFNPAGQRLLAILRSKLGSVPGKPVAPLLEIGEFAGSTYAVTLPVEPFSGLREWVALNLDTSDPKMAETSPLLMSPPEAARAETIPAPPLVSETPVSPPPSPVPSAPPAAAAPGLLADQAGDFSRRFVAMPPVKEKPMPPPAPPPSPIPSPPPVAAAPGLLADQAGEFTRRFVAMPPVKEKPMPPPVPATPAPASLLADQRGEFTRIFDPGPPKSPAPSSSAAPPGEFTRLFDGPLSPQPVAPPAAAQSQGGEFTRLFQAPLGSGEPVKPPPLPAAPPPAACRPDASFPPAAPDSPWPASSASDASLETGQFTRLFGSRLSGESIDIEKEHASAAQSAPPDSRPFQQAGEFTRMFGPSPSGAADSAVPALHAPPPAPDTATRMASAPGTSGAAGASGMFGTPQDLAKYAAEALAASKPADAGPGEYTRMFSLPARQGQEDQAAQQPAAPKPPNPEMQPPKKSRKNLIIIVAVVAAVLVLAIVLVIVLGKR